MKEAASESMLESVRQGEASLNKVTEAIKKAEKEEHQSKTIAQYYCEGTTGTILGVGIRVPLSLPYFAVRSR